MLNELASYLGKSSPLSEFGHALAIAFEINIGYSILLRLGKFATSRIQGWVDSEKLRIIPPLAEDQGFNPGNVHKQLDAFEVSGAKWIVGCNRIAIAWALAAACASVVLLTAVLPFYSEFEISAWQALLASLALMGATPVGIIAWVIIQICVRSKMKKYAEAHNILIENRQNMNAVRIRETRQKLEKKLRTARADNKR